jgi:hypothetical protein
MDNEKQPSHEELSNNEKQKQPSFEELSRREREASGNGSHPEWE